MKIDFKKYIEDSNAAFEVASPAEKRITIAKDVIVRINAKNLVAKRGSFLNVRSYSGDAGDSVSFKDLLNTELSDEEISDNDQSCRVCAKGSLFCSIIGRVNKVTIDQVRNEPFGNNFDDIGHQKLAEYFSKEQIDLIECAFEDTSYLSIVNEEAAQEAYEFGAKYTNPTDRLIGICENIIAHQGTFIP